ncbi:phosphatidylinositol 3-kinase, putative, partial [Entamoeba invadens IP1]
MFERDKIVLFEISTIIDAPMKWDCTNPQEFYFRRCSYHSATDMNIPFIPISSPSTSMPYPSSFPDSFFIKLQITKAVTDFCQLSKQVTTLQISHNYKPSMVIERFLKTVQRVRTDFEVNNKIFYLKTVGYDEYFFDDVPIGNYNYIREMLRLSKPIKVMLVLEAGDFEKKLAIRQKSEELEKNWEFDPLPIELPNLDTIQPHFVIKKKFGIFLESIEMSNEVFQSNTNYVVLLEICFGGAVLWTGRSPMVCHVSNDSLKYKQILLKTWVMFDECQVCRIPKEALLVFKIMEVDKNAKIKRGFSNKDNCPQCHLPAFNTKGRGPSFFCSCGLDLSQEVIESESNMMTIIGWTDIYLFDYRKLMISGNYNLAVMLPPVIPIGIPVTEFGNLNQLNGKISFSMPLGPTIKFDNIKEEETLQNTLTEDEKKKINVSILTTNLLKELTEEDKKLIWKGRCFILEEESLHQHPSSIVLLCQSVPWKEPKEVSIFEEIIKKWPKVTHIIAMRLLHFSFANTFIRQYAVRCLMECSDEHLSTIMMQLIQSLKFEATPLSDLAIFLIHRALNKRSTIGRIFFWLIKSELHIPETQRRFALLLEAYLMVCGDQRVSIKNQIDLCKKLTSLYTQQNQNWKTDQNQLIRELDSINLPKVVYVPFKPSLKFTKIVSLKCKVLDSLRKPLFLTFENEDPVGDPIYIIFKKDDDLRQDMFALKVLEVMNQMWQNEGYDMRLTCYECLAMGNAVGMIEVVLRSETIAAIQKKMYGGNVSAAFQEDPLFRWLKEKNPGKEEMSNAQQNFIFSCAGYCVATYVLGVGDRHNDNILLTPTGHLVHIDFGHILGNVEKFKGFKRETAPFVLTKEFVYVMGGKNSDGFKLFVSLCCDTFLILRKNFHGLINLFTMMLSTGLPELRRTDDMEYLLNSLVLDRSEADARAYFEKLINVALEALMTRVNNAIHIFAHPDVKEDV